MHVSTMCVLFVLHLTIHWKMQEQHGSEPQMAENSVSPELDWCDFYLEKNESLCWCDFEC